MGAFIIVLGLYLIIWGKSKDSSLSSSKNNDVEMFDKETSNDKNQDSTIVSKEGHKGEANV